MPIDHFIRRWLNILFFRQINRALYRGTSVFRRKGRRGPDAVPPARSPASGADTASRAPMRDEANEDQRPSRAQRAAARNVRKAARLTRGLSGRK